MVAGTIEKIQVRLQLLTKGFARGMKNTTTSMQKLNKGINAQAHAFTKLSQKQKIMRVNTRMNNISQQGFFQTMRMGRMEFKDFNEQGRKFTTIGGRTANAIRKSTHGMKGFRMEMLGVMFFGMMLQKTFTGLIKTSLEWMGVMEVFTLALGILFLPVAGLLLEWALKFLQWVSTLTPEQKKLIGMFVLMGAAIGGILFVIGSFALGIGSLILAFKFLFSPIGVVIGLILALAGLSISGMLEGLTGDIDSAGETIVGFGITGEALNKVKEKIMSVITKVKDTIVEKLPEILEKGREMLGKIMEGLEDNAEAIGAFLGGMVSTMLTWIGENSDKIIDVGLKIAKELIKGIHQGLVGFMDGILDKINDEINKFVFGGRGRGRGGVGMDLESFQTGGIVPKTGPIFAHAGETVIPAGKSPGGVILNVTYNIEVSDREEMERLLRDNNLQLVEEVKRQTAI